MNIIDGGITSAKGFSAASFCAGIKSTAKDDMAMIVSDTPCLVAGTFTTNKVFAAPVKWDKKVVYDSEYAQAMKAHALMQLLLIAALPMHVLARRATRLVRQRPVLFSLF